MAEIILNFVGDPTGLKPVVDELNKITGVSEKQAQNFHKVNQEFAKGSEEVKKQAGEFEKLSQKVKNIPIAISGERISKSFKEMGDAAKGAVAGIEQARKKLDDTRRTMSELEKINNQFKRTLFEQEQALKALGTGWSREAPSIRKRIEGLKAAITDNNLALKDMKINERDASNQIRFFKQQESALNKNISSSALLTSQLRKMKDQLANFQGSDKEFIKLETEAAKLSTRIREVNDRVRVLSSPTFTFDAFIGATQGIVGAFTAAQGAMALAGGENEDFQKTIVKVTGSLAVLQGLQATVNALQKQSPAILFAQAAAMKVYNFVTAGAVAVTQALRAVMLTLGFGVVIAGIAYLVTQFSNLKTETEKAKEAQEKHTESIEKAKEAKEALNKEIDKRIEKMQREAQLLRAARADENLSIEAQIRGNKAAIELSEQRIKKDENELAFLDEKVKLLTTQLNVMKTFSQVEKKTIESNQKTLDDTIKQRDELSEAIDQNRFDTDLLKASNEGLTKSLIELNAQSKKAFDEWGEAVRKMREDIELEMFNTGKAAVDNFIKGLEDEDKLRKEAQRVAQKIMDDFRDVVEEATGEEDFDLTLKVQLLTDPEQMKAVKQAAIDGVNEIQNAIFEIAAIRRDEQFQAELQDLDRRREAELSNKNLTDSQKKRIEDKFRKEENVIKRQQFEAEKKASSVQALINGALAITKTLAQLGFTPAGIAAAALSAVTTAAQIAVINKQKFPGFAKGTKSAPEGFAWVGEQGAELVHLNQGAKVLTSKDSQKFAAGVEVPRIAEKYGMNFSHLEMPKYSTPTFTIDYNKMAKSFAEELKNNPQFNLSIDKNGIQVFMQQRNRRVEYLNSKFDV